MDLKDFELIYTQDRCEINDKQKIERKIREIIGDNNISTKEVDILAYTKDASLINCRFTRFYNMARHSGTNMQYFKVCKSRKNSSNTLWRGIWSRWRRNTN